MQTFKAQILDNVASALTGRIAADIALLNDACSEAARDIIFRLPNRALLAASQATFATTNPVTIDTERILNVARKDSVGFREAAEVTSSRQYDIQDTNSMWYGTQYSPKFYRMNGIHVYPAPSSNASVKVEYIGIPSVDASTETTIANFPNEYEHLVTLYATARVLRRDGMRGQDKAAEVISETTFTSFASALPTFAAPSLDAFGSLGTAPTYTGPTSFDWSGTDISDALTNAQNLIDSTATINAETRLTEEDVELATSAVNTAAQEINRANASIQVQLGQLREYEAETREAIQEFQAAIQLYQADLREYEVDTQKVLQKYRAEVEAESVRFQAELQKAVSYFQENRARVEAATQYLNRSQQAFGAAEIYMNQYREAFSE